MDHIWPHLKQRAEDEVSVCDAWVRDLKTGFVDLLTFDQQEIEVERAVSPPLRATASGAVFDVDAYIEKFLGA